MKIVHICRLCIPIEHTDPPLTVANFFCPKCGKLAATFFYCIFCLILVWEERMSRIYAVCLSVYVCLERLSLKACPYSNLELFQNFG